MDIYAYDTEKYSGLRGKIIGFSEHHIAKRGWKAATTVWWNGPEYEQHEEYIEKASMLLNTEFNLDPNRSLMIGFLQAEINEWLKQNCVGRWDKLNCYSVEFELEEDAVLYKLVWI